MQMSKDKKTALLLVVLSATTLALRLWELHRERETELCRELEMNDWAMTHFDLGYLSCLAGLPYNGSDPDMMAAFGPKASVDDNF